MKRGLGSDAKPFLHQLRLREAELANQRGPVFVPSATHRVATLSRRIQKRRRDPPATPETQSRGRPPS